MTEAELSDAYSRLKVIHFGLRMKYDALKYSHKSLKLELDKLRQELSEVTKNLADISKEFNDGYANSKTHRKLLSRQKKFEEYYAQCMAELLELRKLQPIPKELQYNP